jgi:hypothetical protein
MIDFAQSMAADFSQPGPYRIHSEVRGAHWAAWVSRDGDQPDGSGPGRAEQPGPQGAGQSGPAKAGRYRVVVIGATKEEAEARARARAEASD